MELTVEVVATGDDGPPAGSPVIVQIRDAGYADAAAETVAEKRVKSKAAKDGGPIARAKVKLDGESKHAIVWVHVDVDKSGDVSTGDYITMQSYPVRGDSIRVEVKPVR